MHLSPNTNLSPKRYFSSMARLLLVDEGFLKSRCSSAARPRGCFCPSRASPVDGASCRHRCPPLPRQRVIATRAGFARSRAVAAVNSHTGRRERTYKQLTIITHAAPSPFVSGPRYFTTDLLQSNLNNSRISTFYFNIF